MKRSRDNPSARHSVRACPQDRPTASQGSNRLAIVNESTKEAQPMQANSSLLTSQHAGVRNVIPNDETSNTIDSSLQLWSTANTDLKMTERQDDDKKKSICLFYRQSIALS
jgi:hypothetical protein